MGCCEFSFRSRIVIVALLSCPTAPHQRGREREREEEEEEEEEMEILIS